MDGIKPLRWIASSKDNLSAMPIEVRRAVGYVLFAAQQGEKHDDAKVLKGFGDAGVLEVVARHDGDTFRAVYTVRLLKRSTCCTSFRRSRSAASPHRRRIWT
jgi:phage-related protein